MLLLAHYTIRTLQVGEKNYAPDEWQSFRVLFMKKVLSLSLFSNSERRVHAVDYVETVLLHDGVEVSITPGIGVEFDCDRAHLSNPRMITLERFHLGAFDIHF